MGIPFPLTLNLLKDCRNIVTRSLLTAVSRSSFNKFRTSGKRRYAMLTVTGR